MRYRFKKSFQHSTLSLKLFQVAMPTYACVQTDRHEGGLEEVVWEEVPAQVQEAVQDTHPALLRRTWPWHRLYM